MSTKTYQICFVPCDAFGHVNACLGLAQSLTQFGHKCVFVVNQTWKDLIVGLGFDVEVYIEAHKEGVNGIDVWIKSMRESRHSLILSSFDKIREFEAPGWPTMTADVKTFNTDVQRIIDSVKPDAIVADNLISVPAVVSADVPWIDLISCNPLYYWSDERLPPGGSGYPTNGDKKLWQEFREETYSAYSDEWHSFNQWLQSVGAPALQHCGHFSNPSPFLNLYLCPQELDYKDIAPKDTKLWLNIDSLIRSDIETQTKTFEIPEELRQKSGKLIYLSMGTLCCVELSLMRRLVSLLSHSKHRFIISKGPLGEEYELADNMWGQNSLPQLQVLRLVDLVLTHGGNNTVTETMHFGKPLIVLPVFADQYDNAQRVVEKGLGLRLDPFFCSQSELFEAIDELLNDSNLSQRCLKISERIRKSESKAKAVKRIEEVIQEYQEKS
ncbi:unnamed protein product [Medioppia subpectinata]|uniref:UDP-glycosyltransferase n=1 Tax=Medioppia subpectinata TaxID=1979941 RepID=A0A7R9Q2S2_9ACAR|nr:unnamed protein product [Medioppia subpectinata]CAG2110689.1 unnamed protein product [Medioppia subpectinata]